MYVHEPLRTLTFSPIIIIHGKTGYNLGAVVVSIETGAFVHFCFVFFILFFSSYIFSQSIDDKFLESLPENIQQDVLSEASKNNDEDIIFRSPNTRQELPLETVNRLVSEIEELKKKIEESKSWITKKSKS